MNNLELLLKNLKKQLTDGLLLIDQIAIENNLEIWREINGYPYEVSTFGKVRHCFTGRYIKIIVNRDGYKSVNLYLWGRCSKHKVHRLVANAFLLNIENKQCVDHKDNDTSNNNVNNLRFATIQENSFNTKIAKNNTSGVKGVNWCKRSRKWHAKIKHNGKTIHIGRFHDLENAKQARREKARQLFGEFINSCEL